MSYLKKVKFTVINGIPVTDTYGYVETLTSIPVRDTRTGSDTEFVLGLYDINGNVMNVTPSTTWDNLSFSAYVWNDIDLENAIEILREYTETSDVRKKTP